MSSTTQHVVAARLTDGRLLIARLDPGTPTRHSPLRRALAAAGINLKPVTIPQRD